MNLHLIAGDAVNVLSPWILGNVKKSTGYTTEPDGTRIPIYEDEDVLLKVQSLAWKEVQIVDGLNIQGEKRAMYIEGNYGGNIRADGTGGELITLPDGTIWLSVMVLENWFITSGWVKLAVVRQLS